MLMSFCRCRNPPTRQRVLSSVVKKREARVEGGIVSIRGLWVKGNGDKRCSKVSGGPAWEDAKETTGLVFGHIGTSH